MVEYRKRRKQCTLFLDSTKDILDLPKPEAVKISPPVAETHLDYNLVQTQGRSGGKRDEREPAEPVEHLLQKQ